MDADKPRSTVDSLRLGVASFAISVVVGLIAGCGPLPPPTFVQSFDDPGRWVSIEVREGLTREAAWQTVVDTLAHKYDLEVLDKDSGYLRTAWKHTWIVDGQVVAQYRARIVVKMLQDWTVAQVKCEANWLRGGGWIVGHDTRLLDDAYGDLQGRIGRVRR